MILKSLFSQTCLYMCVCMCVCACRDPGRPEQGTDLWSCWYRQLGTPIMGAGDWTCALRKGSKCSQPLSRLRIPTFYSLFDQSLILFCSCGDASSFPSKGSDEHQPLLGGYDQNTPDFSLEMDSLSEIISHSSNCCKWVPPRSSSLPFPISPYSS